MKNLSSLIAAKIFLICVLFGLLTAMAMPKYLDINKCNQKNICQANQILVETALAVAYADSLAKGIHHFPQKLIAAMFEDEKIPTCPVDGRYIEFDPATGKAFCPHHIKCHTRKSE
jgi:hypothetical protein